MPTRKQVVTAHFKGLNLKPNETVGEAIIIPWVSPEQEYYADINCVAALVDLINKTFDHRSSEVCTVIAGYLQRFNFYERTFEEVSPSEVDMAACKAMSLGKSWYLDKKKILKCLDFSRHVHKIFWQEILTAEQHISAKRYIDEIYASSPQYQASFQETSKAFFKSKASKEEAQLSEEIFVHNSQEYLREECAFLYALPQLYNKEIAKGKKIYVVYPRGASPAVKITIDLIQQQYPNTIYWLCADLKVRNPEKFDLQQYLTSSPHCGCSSGIKQLIQAKAKSGVGVGFFDSSQPMLNPQTLSPTLLVEADDEWSHFMRGSMLYHATQSPPKEDLSSHLSKFLGKLKEMSDKSSESGSSSPLSLSSRSLSDSGDEAAASGDLSTPVVDAVLAVDETAPPPLKTTN